MPIQRSPKLCAEPVFSTSDNIYGDCAVQSRSSKRSIKSVFMFYPCSAAKWIRLIPDEQVIGERSTEIPFLLNLSLTVWTPKNKPLQQKLSLWWTVRRSGCSGTRANNPLDPHGQTPETPHFSVHLLTSLLNHLTVLAQWRDIFKLFGKTIRKTFRKIFWKTGSWRCRLLNHYYSMKYIYLNPVV
jgi:hypothetical protein